MEIIKADIMGYCMGVRRAVDNAEKAIKVLGGKLEKVHEVFWEGLEHRVVVIRKVCKTPSKYPRNAGKPSKEPII